ncbi:MAG TPA: tripartite tricarboxylate transporter substrate binding protein [Burkholderiaceae bacterium]|jgi:tripartite-type tricarboxylate transporter receptor subunit TctC
MKRLQFFFACFVGALFAPSIATADDYPSRPVRLIVPFAPGGATDVVARALSAGLSTKLGQPVVVENRPGAGGIVAAQLVANAKPDGYVLLMGSIGLLAIIPNLRNDLPYDNDKSFAAVSPVSATPNVIVAHPSFVPNNVRELIALARHAPGTISFGSSGTGTSTHLSGELFEAMSGTKLVHVPYRGGSLALTDLLAGQIPLQFDTMSSVAAIRSGKLKAIAVTSDKRSALLPDVPTVAESGLPGYVATSWNGIIAPAGTPREIVTKLNGAIAQVLAMPEITRSLSLDGSEVRTSSPEQFATFIRDERERWGKLINSAHITVTQ